MATLIVARNLESMQARTGATSGAQTAVSLEGSPPSHTYCIGLECSKGGRRGFSSVAVGASQGSNPLIMSALAYPDDMGRIGLASAIFFVHSLPRQHCTGHMSGLPLLSDEACVHEDVGRDQCSDLSSVRHSSIIKKGTATSWGLSKQTSSTSTSQLLLGLEPTSVSVRNIFQDMFECSCAQSAHNVILSRGNANPHQNQHSPIYLTSLGLGIGDGLDVSCLLSLKCATSLRHFCSPVIWEVRSTKNSFVGSIGGGFA